MKTRRAPNKERALIDRFKHAIVYLDDDTAADLERYHLALEAGGVCGSPSDTIREVISIGMDRKPEVSVVKRPHNEARVYVLSRLHTFLAELLREVEYAAESGAMLVAPKKDPDNGNQI